MNHPVWTDRIILVDTPGFKDATISEYASIKAIREWILTHNIPPLHALFYFDRITYPLRGGDKECWAIFMNLCGENMARKACLVSTAWDDVGNREGISEETAAKSLLRAEKKWQELASYWKNYTYKGLQFHKFYNTPKSGQDILTSSLNCGDVSMTINFNLEKPEFSLEKPPIEEFIIQLLVEKHESVVTALDLVVQGITALREAEEKTDVEERQLAEYSADLRRLKAELTRFPNATDVQKTKRPGAKLFESGKVLEALRLDSLVQVINSAIDPPMEDIHLDDIIIAVMGPTGTGKTSFIQAVAGENYYVGRRDIGHSVEGGSIGVSYVSVPITGTHSNLILVDTPGFDDPGKQDVQTLEIIATWLESTYQRRVLLSGLVYLHRITDIRHDVDIQNTMNAFQSIAGPNALERVALVTTMWNDLRNKKIGIEREAQLMNMHWRPMILRKVTMIGRFDAEDRNGAVKIIMEMVEKNNKTVMLQLQDELTNKRINLPSTSAEKVALTLEKAMTWRLRQLETVLKA
ncbi:hypothetical protein CVT24_000219 [Panaeolus cyanescens]|uniref:Uncharacterized protein n=1 Tax=Panaeolus cyanescens TaxID=181874 RepID=A0A409VIN2_9AGAR|nr:hypothetical protein CVT24_000219 [Panaeolus cyanescens]